MYAFGSCQKSIQKLQYSNIFGHTYVQACVIQACRSYRESGWKHVVLVIHVHAFTSFSHLRRKVSGIQESWQALGSNYTQIGKVSASNVYSHVLALDYAILQVFTV
jgi:hypothetical protein